MASERRLSRTSGNKRITLLGTKLCEGDSIAFDSSEEKHPNNVFDEEGTTKDDASIPTTRKGSALKRSVSMSSALLRKKTPNRKPFLSVIEDSVEDEDPSMQVLCPSASSESEGETLNEASVVRATASTNHKSTTEEKGSTFDDTFVVGPSSSKTVARGKQAQLEETASITWELPEFTKDYKRYLDNESKYFDENEAAAVKTSLIEIGEKIDCRSVFLANLYFSQCDNSDINQNEEGRVNLNFEEGTRRASASYEANPLEITHILVMVTMKLVDSLSEQQGTLLHYRVDLRSNSNGRILASFVHFLTSIKFGGLASFACQLDMKRFFSKMDTEDCLQIELNCTVYRPIIEWGLKIKEPEEIWGFMLGGKVEKSNRRKVSELADKCKELKLVGIVECLENLLPHKFFEDE